MSCKHITLALLASAVLCVPAMAQTTNAPASGSAAAPASTGKWLTQEKAGEWRASKLKGVDVYNNNNEKIGDVSELIVSKDGKIEAVVVGVGGFLGMGQHDVAVPFNEIKWEEQPRNASTVASANRNAAGATATGTVNTAPGATTGTTAPATTAAVPGTTTGTTASTSAANRTAANDANRSYPDHGVLNMTKDQLRAAPEFKFAR